MTSTHLPTLAIIQARLGSTRLPRKILAHIQGEPMLRHVIRRAHAIRGVERVVVAVPHEDGGELEGRHHWDCPVWVASSDLAPNDVLGRFVEVVGEHPWAERIVRLTGDCPLLCPDIAEVVLQRQAETAHPYCSNVLPGEYVDGTDVEVFTVEHLVRAVALATPHTREHVTPWMHEQAEWLAFELCPPPLWPHRALKLSVDTPEDLARVEAIMRRMPLGRMDSEALAGVLKERRAQHV